MMIILSIILGIIAFTNNTGDGCYHYSPGILAREWSHFLRIVSIFCLDSGPVWVIYTRWCLVSEQLYILHCEKSRIGLVNVSKKVQSMELCK